MEQIIRGPKFEEVWQLGSEEFTFQGSGEDFAQTKFFIFLDKKHKFFIMTKDDFFDPKLKKVLLKEPMTLEQYRAQTIEKYVNEIDADIQKESELSTSGILNCRVRSDEVDVLAALEKRFKSRGYTFNQLQTNLQIHWKRI